MRTNLNTRPRNYSVDEVGTPIWHRLHNERENICETLLKESSAPSQANSDTMATGMDETSVLWHKGLLQARLRKIDDALDRLMSGSYGNCYMCGRWIEDTKLAFDPAVALCTECWQREQNDRRSSDGASAKREPELVEDNSKANPPNNPSLTNVTLTELSPFDTIWARTANSDYRFFLLDNTTGRALVEGGLQFVEPIEATVAGSTGGGTNFKLGQIAVGSRMEIWTNHSLLITSPVQSIRVAHCLGLQPLGLCQ